jgi:hypothetical protein
MQRKITSLYGEDEIIDFLTELIKEKIRKLCLEVGAGDKVTKANVYTLWKDKARGHS